MEKNHKTQLQSWENGHEEGTEKFQQGHATTMHCVDLFDSCWMYGNYINLGFFAVISAPLGVSAVVSMHVLHLMLGVWLLQKEAAILWQGASFLFPQKTTSLTEWLLDISHFCFAEIFKGQYSVRMNDRAGRQFLWFESLCSKSSNRIIVSKLVVLVSVQHPWSLSCFIVLQHRIAVMVMLFYDYWFGWDTPQCWREYFYWAWELCI